MDNQSKVLVWDLPTRVFHWLLVISFVTAYATAEGEHYRSIHVLAGYTVAGLMIFRLIWGVLGTRYARFTQFIRSPMAAIRYFKAIRNGQPEHHVGHNPAGALAIIALLLLGLITPLTGWLTFSDTADVGDVHELLGNAFVALVVVHVIAVIASSWLHKENLARAMVTGKKQAGPHEGIRSAKPWIAGVLLLGVAGFVYAGYGGSKSLLAQQPALAPLFQDNRLEAGDEEGDSEEIHAEGDHQDGPVLAAMDNKHQDDDHDEEDDDDEDAAHERRDRDHPAGKHKD